VVSRRICKNWLNIFLGNLVFASECFCWSLWTKAGPHVPPIQESGSSWRIYGLYGFSKGFANTVKPQYYVSLGTKKFQRYIEINVISREKYMDVCGEGKNFLDFISREHVKLRYVILGFHCIGKLFGSPVFNFHFC
jgi:hypothetical protein